MATKPIPVRIPADWLARIDKAATKLGTNRARLIAFCAQTFAENFERTGKASMPPNWEEIFQQMDGRTTESKLTKYPTGGDGDASPNETKTEKAEAVKSSSANAAESAHYTANLAGRPHKKARKRLPNK